jgi:hypothetical protein
MGHIIIVHLREYHTSETERAREREQVPEAEALTVAQDGRVAHHFGDVALEPRDQAVVGAGVMVSTASERA